jgi:hypothetical protein
MSARLQPQPTLYEQLDALPEGLTGEILKARNCATVTSYLPMAKGCLIATECCCPISPRRFN